MVSAPVDGWTGGTVAFDLKSHEICSSRLLTDMGDASFCHQILPTGFVVLA